MCPGFRADCRLLQAEWCSGRGWCDRSGSGSGRTASPGTSTAPSYPTSRGACSDMQVAIPLWSSQQICLFLPNYFFFHLFISRCQQSYPQHNYRDKNFLPMALFSLALYCCLNVISAVWGEIRAEWTALLQIQVRGSEPELWESLHPDSFDIQLILWLLSSRVGKR